MTLDYLRQYAPRSETLEPDAESGAAPPSAGPLEGLLDTPVVGPADAACLVTESVWGAEHVHGLHAFSGLSGLTPDALALISNDPELRFAHISEAVFLDTETTGLSTGAGTYVFLVGMGYFDGESFRVRQFFLRDPGEELPFLHELQRFLERFSVLVTFNGKAFDWPLLESRFIRERSIRRAPLEDPPHVDLLHPARRLWKRRLESCALSSLERQILQVQRTGEDVPGWLIPSLYFRYLRSGDGAPLRNVFYHNLQDILSLAILAIHIDRVMRDPMCGLVCHGTDYLCLGKLFDRAGDQELAAACLEEALRRELAGRERAECLVRLGDIHRRERRWEPALSVWERLIDGGGEGALHGLVERAKYHEHVERDYLEALDDVQQALNLLDLIGSDNGMAGRRELEHRQARLVSRAYRHRSWAR